MYVKLTDKNGSPVQPVIGASSKGRSIAVNASTDYVLLLPLSHRVFFSVQNMSTSAMYLKYDAPEYDTWTVRIPPKWYFESPVTVWQGAITGKWDVANGQANITELY